MAKALPPAMSPDRFKRRADALRENLMRRKAQSRARDAEPEAPPPGDDPATDR